MTKLKSSSVLTAHNMKMPVVGLGTWQSTDEEMERAINAALELGYRHIDTAFLYMNEAAVGGALDKWLSAGRIRREELFIVTKLPPNGMRPEHVERFLKKSLENLKLDYVDLYLVHVPIGYKYRGDNNTFPVNDKGEYELDMETDHIAIWKEMEKQVEVGRAKSIGISNFNIRQIDRILKNCTVPPSNIQIELHLYHQEPELVNHCLKNGITVCGYAPLGSPSLADYKKKSGFETDDNLVPLSDPVVNNIAKKHGKTPANVLLRFVLQLGAAVIPKSTNPQRIKQNFEVFDFELNEVEMAELKSLDRGKDGRMFGIAVRGSEEHPEFPFEK